MKYDDPFSKRLDLFFAPRTLNGWETTCSLTCRNVVESYGGKNDDPCDQGLEGFFAFRPAEGRKGKPGSRFPKPRTYFSRGLVAEKKRISALSVTRGMVWESLRKTDDSCNKGLEVLFMLHALCGQEMME